MICKYPLSFHQNHVLNGSFKRIQIIIPKEWEVVMDTERTNWVSGSN